MLEKILAFFENKEVEVEQMSVDTAAAVILIEIMMADYDIDSRERSVIKDILARRTNGSVSDIDALIEVAMAKQKDSVDLYQFSKVLNEHWSEDERYRLIVDLWRVAFADGDLDKYEDHRIRQVNDLLYLHHSHFIKAKAEAQNIL